MIMTLPGPLYVLLLENEALRFYDVLISSSRLNDVEKARYKQLVMVDQANRESFIMSDAVLMGSPQDPLCIAGKALWQQGNRFN